MLRGGTEVAAGAGNILGAVGKNIAREYMGSAGIGTAARAAKEAAYQGTKKKALSFLNRRVAPAALAYGGGQLAGSYIETRAEERRAYYGNRAYEKRYGTSAETAASLVRSAGSIIGASALLGMTPSIRRGIAEFGPRRALKAQMRSARREMDASLRTAARTKAENALYGINGQGATRTVVPGQLNLKFDELAMGRRPGQNPIDFLMGNLNKADRARVETLATGARERARNAVSDIGRKPAKFRRVREKAADAAYEQTARGELTTIFNQKLLPSRQAAARNAIRNEEKLINRRARQEYRDMKKGKGSAYRADARYLENNIAAADPVAGVRYRGAKTAFDTSSKALKAMGPSQFSSVGKAIKYGSIATGIGATMEPVIDNPLGSFLTGVGITVGAAAALRPMTALKFVRSAAVPVGVAAATIATGAALGGSIPAPAAAEGNIEEVMYNKTSPVRKLNYSTAGLVQSIHNNRRMR